MTRPGLARTSQACGPRELYTRQPKGFSVQRPPHAA